MIWKWIVFLIVSAGIVYISRRSLLTWRSHGFFRFFAFEAILILILLNAGFWFRDPFSVRQIASWLLLFASLLLAIHAFTLLRRMGKPDRGINDSKRLGVEKTTCLVTTGAYRYIRHPLYTSLLFFSLGAFLKQPSLFAAMLAGITTVALYATARVEERENLDNFDAEYAEYMQRTKMFFPWLF
jgi:protein-S-isoprenylcysteine O-methyltransferase Ste14